MKKIKKLIKIILFLIIFGIFIYLRITPILNQTVPYTYDQGRDFLKAEEIVRFKNMTFLGPTTGIMGLNHGPWWYYFLSISYFFFNGYPLGFYYFMFIFSIIANLLFFYFLQKEYNFKTALLFLTIVSVSPYFIGISFFVSNNIVVPYIILGLIISIFYLFKNKNHSFWIFLTGLFLGFIHEFEVSFGLFIIPIFLLLTLIFKKIRKIFLIKTGILNFLLGLFIAFLPRILFETKHGFSQTKTLIKFIISPKLHNPKPFKIVFYDRINLFINYFKSIFIEYNLYLAIFALLTVISIVVFYKKNLKKHFYLIFNIFLIVFLFLTSLFYKDNFWANYYEGIQYLMLFIFLICFYILDKNHRFFGKIILIVFMIYAITFFVNNLYFDNNKIKDFKAIDKAVNYIVNKNGKKDFCVRIYTPPVIPYTYNYLFSYYSKIKNIPYPKENWINNRCYFIIEKDDYLFRFEEWMKNNIPENSHIISTHKINNDIKIELWEKN